MARTFENSKYLPEELIIEILLHVQDVKSLGQCKCVSKTWQSLLSRPQFAKSSFIGPEKIFFLGDSKSDEPGDRDHPRCVLTFSTENNGNLGVVTTTRFPNFDQNNFNSFDPVQGSCGGLILLLFCDGLILENPTLRQSLEIPPYGKEYRYGLGYDSRTDDYKVVSVQKDNVHVYSVRSRTWRTFPNPSDLYHETFQRVFVNGCLHFVSYAGVVEPGHRNVIAAFNVGNEEFNRVPYPKGFGSLRASEDHLTVLGGCLAMMILVSGDSCDVWMMKVYGVQDSWTKFSVNISPYSHRVLCFLGEDEMVWVNASHCKFVAHNWRSGVSRDIIVDCLPDGIWSRTGISFRESFISPNNFS